MDNQAGPNKIELVDDKILNNEEFKKNVAIPYFKDIFKDLAAQSDDKSKGINKVTLLTYCNLPGIIGERFFAVMDLSKTEYIDLREFVHGFFKIYYSNLETKIKLSFDIYDFDRDGYITKEDVRLILSHVPIVNQVQGQNINEGSFTRDGGGNHAFLDRIETQEEIQLLIQSCFGDKKRINYDDYVKLNQDVSSEMFLSILTLLQTNIPCSVNFYRYKNNYEKYLDDGTGNANNVTVKQLSSPRFMKRLSPIQQLAKTQGFAVNPESQGGLLKYAMNKPAGATEEANQKAADDSDDEDMDVSKFGSKTKDKSQKEQRKKEIEALKAKGQDVIMEAEATRQANQRAKVQVDAITGTAKVNKDADVFMSPSTFLNGASPRMSNFMAQGEDDCI